MRWILRILGTDSCSSLGRREELGLCRGVVGVVAADRREGELRGGGEGRSAEVLGGWTGGEEEEVGAPGTVEQDRPSNRDSY